MKINFKKSFIAALLISVPLLMIAQPPHPNNGGAPSAGSNTKVGDQPSAPVGSGTFILTLLAMAYGGRKLYGSHTSEEK